VIHVAVDDAVVVLTLDRPERRNAVNHATLVELRAALDQARADRARVVVLAGAGGTFCAGADLTGVEDEGFAGELAAVLRSLTELPAATIAAVEGAALGAGCQLAIACDLRVAATDALFGIPAVRLGLMVDAWTIERLVQMVGGSTARAILLAGERVSAADANRVGLVNRIGDREAAMAWAHHISGLAPLSVAGHKLALERLGSPSPPSDEVLAVIHGVWASADAVEGRAAFLEKRPPAFQGR
jgi:enoyl-CoA hydratase